MTASQLIITFLFPLFFFQQLPNTHVTLAFFCALRGQSSEKQRFAVTCVHGAASCINRGSGTSFCMWLCQMGLLSASSPEQGAHSAFRSHVPTAYRTRAQLAGTYAADLATGERAAAFETQFLAPAVPSLPCRPCAQSLFSSALEGNSIAAQQGLLRYRSQGHGHGHGPGLAEKASGQSSTPTRQRRSQTQESFPPQQKVFKGRLHQSNKKLLEAGAIRCAR